MRARRGWWTAPRKCTRWCWRATWWTKATPTGAGTTPTPRARRWYEGGRAAGLAGRAGGVPGGAGPGRRRQPARPAAGRRAVQPHLPARRRDRAPRAAQAAARRAAVLGPCRGPRMTLDGRAGRLGGAGVAHAALLR